MAREWGWGWDNNTLALRLDAQAEIECVKRGGILLLALEGLAA